MAVNCEQIAAVVLHCTQTQPCVLCMAKPVGGPQQGIGDAGLGGGVAGIGHHDEVGLRPGLVEVPGRDGWRHHVIAALDDDARNAGQPVGVGDQLVVLPEEAAIDEIVALDAGEGDGEMIGAELRHALRIREQGNGGALPLASGPVSRR